MKYLIMLLIPLVLNSCAGFHARGPGKHGGSVTGMALISKQSFTGMKSPLLSFDTYAADSEEGGRIVRDTIIWGIGLQQLGSYARTASNNAVAETAIKGKTATSLGAQKAGVATSKIRADTIKVVNPELVPISIKPL